MSVLRKMSVEREELSELQVGRKQKDVVPCARYGPLVQGSTLKIITICSFFGGKVGWRSGHTVYQ